VRTIISGSRGLGILEVESAISKAPFMITVVLSGTARGVDQAGERWALQHSIPVERYPADWSTGRGAGYRRNELMAEKAEALIAVWDGSSRGTKHMIDIAQSKGLKVFVWRTG